MLGSLFFLSSSIQEPQPSGTTQQTLKGILILNIVYLISITYLLVDNQIHGVVYCTVGVRSMERTRNLRFSLQPVQIK